MNHTTDKLQQDSHTDTVIAVDQTVPTGESAASTAHSTFPPQSHDRSDVHYNDEILRPISPPFRGEPAPAFRYPGGSIRGDYTPSILSGHLPGHQQSSRPYMSSLRNDYHPPLGGHRVDSHHHAHPRDAGKPMVIDYAGLDASVAAASLVESGYQHASFVEPTDTDSKEKEAAQSGGKSLCRSESTASSVRLASSVTNGNNEFRRRSARKASFYSERAPR
ncbi:hypothetical protein EDD21DRAFT_393847, partial [Dissophora ornata]